MGRGTDVCFLGLCPARKKCCDGKRQCPLSAPEMSHAPITNTVFLPLPSGGGVGCLEKQYLSYKTRMEDFLHHENSIKRKTQTFSSSSLIILEEAFLKGDRSPSVTGLHKGQEKQSVLPRDILVLYKGAEQVFERTFNGQEKKNH